MENEILKKKSNEEANKEFSEDGVPLLRVGSRTPVKPLAGAITATIKEYGCVQLRAIGDGAIGRAVRASIISRGHLITAGIDLIVIPSFFVTEISGSDKTGVTIMLENR